MDPRERPLVLKLLYNNTLVVFCVTMSGCWFVSPLAAACGLYSGRETIHSQCLAIPAEACQFVSVQLSEATSLCAFE